MSHSDYAWAGECHAVAIGIQDNELASKLESQCISSVVKQAGTTCINKNSTNGDSTSGIPLSYSLDYDAQVYVAMDTQPCSRDLSRDDWWVQNPHVALKLYHQDHHRK